jgi:hypothetical protein
VVLVNPNGVVIGAGAQVNVGSFIASTANISNANFMAGRLQFDQPGKPGAEIVNAGSITAAEGGLVALVAPHVRNDGLIQARLGKVILGAADTFTIDLYGDELVSLALTEGQAGVIRQAGIIDVGAGRAVLVSAADAKNVLDNVINMSGTIKADSAVAQGGKIYLLGEGASIDVSGTLSANGATGGGTIHVGGGFQGAGADRARTTTIEAGATLQANANGRGNGGEVVVWSDGSTSFAGAIQAKGGVAAGDGGRMEVSGKSTLAFLGSANASAPAGTAGSLLLDPAILDLGPTEAGLISRVLRTGTSTTLAADIDINVNSLIDGRGRATGGGLTLTAGNNINVNDFVVTNNGAINLFATAGTVNVASGKAVFAGAAPITVRTGGTLHTGPFLTGGMLSLTSTAGAVAIDTFIDGGTGRVDITAAGDVNINQPVVNMASGNPLNVTAGNDVNINAQVDGRGGVPGGAATFVASRNVNANDFVVTNNGAIGITATNGAATVAAGKGLFSGTAPLSMSAAGNLTSGISSSGSLALTSHAGSVNVAGLIDSATGATAISAAIDVNINQPVLNMSTGNTLTVSAGNDINVAVPLDGRGGAAGGGVTMTAGRNLAVNDLIVTNNGAINLAATNGSTTVASGKGLFAGTAPIAVSGKTGVSAAALSGGTVTLGSSAGAVGLNGVIDASTGRVDISAGTDINVNQPVLSLRSGNPFSATAGQDINVNGQIDGRNGVAGGAVTLNAGHNVNVNEFIVTNDGAIAIHAAGAATVASAKGLAAGAGAIAMNAGGNIATGSFSGGVLTLASSGGSVSLNGIIDASTGRADISAGTDVNMNQPVFNLRTGNPLNVTAGHDINVNAPVDGRDGVAGGAVNLTAGRNVTVNESISTNNGAISIAASAGAATVAPNRFLSAGLAPVSISAGGNIVTGMVNAASLNANSSTGTVTLSGEMFQIGRIDVSAGADVNINQAMSLGPLNLAASQDINVNAPIFAGVTTLAAGRNVNLLENVLANTISVTAQTGTVTTAAGKSLFAGAGAIEVTAGGNLSTGGLVTTGTVTARSTGGSLNVDAPIERGTGATTLVAANAVNLNQQISNRRADAPLTVTAGTNINVNAPIDGRDSVLQQSGSVTLVAGQDVNLNQDIITNNAAISVAAQNGTLVTAPAKGLYSGTAPIAVASGATLNTGITSTTGSLSLASTAGSVNVNTPIADTTGAVAIAAASAVNINQPITNIKTGKPLVINAGGDINVNAQIDGRSGTASGGSVSLTAGNNLRLFDHITTNDGPINLTTIVGSVLLAPVSQDANLLITAPPKQVRAGSAPITIVSGGDFSTGAPPPQPLPQPPAGTTDFEAYQRGFLKEYVQLITTGALNITSTHGNVNVIAPISDETGPVTITAGNTINILHKINSNNQPIVLNGGTGGIKVFAMDDSCAGTIQCHRTPPVDARMADLTLNSIGDVSMLGGVATAKTLTVDTRGKILDGGIGASTAGGFPQKVVLNADQGIVGFGTGTSKEVFATSIAGSINLGFFFPDKVRITTGTPDPNNPTIATDCATCDISTFSMFFGPDVAFNAGGSVNLLSVFTGGTATFIARAGDVNLNRALLDSQLTVSAGRDVKLNASGCTTASGGDYCGLVWVGPDPNKADPSGPLSITAGRDIITDAFSPIHVSNSQSLTALAGRDVTLNVVETLGPVSITANTGSTTLKNDIGPHIVNNTGQPNFNPSDLGVASLAMSAPAGSISMQGARAVANVTISTGGTLDAAKQIISTSGSVTVTAPTQNLHQAVAIGSQEQLFWELPISPLVTPGPSVPSPAAPGVVSFGAIIPSPFIDTLLITQPGVPTIGLLSPGPSSGVAALPGAPAGANAPAGGATQTAALPGTAAGFSTLIPGATADESALNTESAVRAAQLAARGDDRVEGDAAVVALAATESEVVCPAGVAPGSSIQRKDAAGAQVTVKCK